MRLSSLLFTGLVVAGCGQAFSAAPSGASTNDASVSGEAGDDTDAATPPNGDAGCSAPASCPGLGWQCGKGIDACGRTVDCGACTKANESCDASHQCKCTPITCQSVGAECGSILDGCGNTISCGTCEGGANCGGGGALKCGSGTCTPATCTSLNAACGSIDDGCGDIVQCPDDCVAPQTCGATGNPNQCGCVPQTCTSLGYECGSADDGCGNTLDCGECDGGTCNANSHSCGCVPQQTCASQGFTCGSFTDSCNAVETCGPPPTSYPLFDKTGCTDSQYPDFYSCCTPNGGVTPGVEPAGGDPSKDAGLTCLTGPPPPGCISVGTPPNQNFCCAQ